MTGHRLQCHHCSSFVLQLPMSNVVKKGFGHSHKMLYILFISLYVFFPLHKNKHSTDLSFGVATPKNPSDVPLTFPRWVCADSPSCSVPRAPAHPALPGNGNLSSAHLIPGALALSTRPREPVHPIMLWETLAVTFRRPVQIARTEGKHPTW